MYVTDNVQYFFVGLDGEIYIVYPYGNSNFTSEIDIVKIQTKEDEKHPLLFLKC